MSVCGIHALKHRWKWRSQGSVRSPGDRLIGGFERQCMGPEHWT